MMRELVSPAQSETLVIVFTLLTVFVGAVFGWKNLGARGAVLLGMSGMLIYPLWRFHSWITRYDPQSGYFGLDQVRVLALEAAIFVALGAAIGTAWNFLTTQKQRENVARDTSHSH